MRKIWLITTDHLEEELWFRDEEDFSVGMNFVAIQTVCCPEVVVLAFILMSNHYMRASQSVSVWDGRRVFQ